MPMIRRAHLLWRELEQSTDGVPLLTLSGLLMLGDSTSAEQSNVMEAIEQFGVRAETIPLNKARKRWPHHPWRDVDWVIFDREAGYIRPELAVWHAARRAEALGARLRTHTAVTSLDVERMTVSGLVQLDSANISTTSSSRRVRGLRSFWVGSRRTLRYGGCSRPGSRPFN